MKDLDNIIERLSNFGNLYDTLRLVDPVNKKTVILKDDVMCIENGYCYDFLQKSSSCENCVSMRALKEKATCLKVEIKNDKIFLLIASLCSINDSEYVVEMMKDISKGSNILKDEKNIKDMSEITETLNNRFIKDELTGTYNLRYINERLPVDIKSSIHNGQPLSIIVVNIDGIKMINDTYGHSYGDNILKDFAKSIISSIRSTTDWVGRYSGEEFIIILKNTDVNIAHKVAENISISIEKIALNYEYLSMAITPNFRVTEINNQNLSHDEIITYADKGLNKVYKIERDEADM